MTNVILQPCSPGEPRKHYVDTVQNPVILEDYGAFIDPEDFDQLENLATNGRIALWGLVDNRSLVRYEKMEVGDTVLFIGNRKVFFKGTVAFNFLILIWLVNSGGRIPTEEHGSICTPSLMVKKLRFQAKS